MVNNVLFFLKNKNQVKFLYDYLSFEEGIRLMRMHGFTAAPVINAKGEYVGTISEGDFLWYITDHMDSQDSEEIKEMPIKEIIRQNYMPAVSINVSIDELFKVSLQQNFVPVVDDRNIFIGIVTRQKIISYLMDTPNQQDIFNQINPQWYSHLPDLIQIK